MEKIALDQAVVNEAIVKAAIYPSIGIARVGNSLTGWYVGPEVPDPLPLPPGSYRDDAGALKREASRFRILWSERRWNDRSGIDQCGRRHYLDRATGQ